MVPLHARSRPPSYARWPALPAAALIVASACQSAPDALPSLEDVPSWTLEEELRIGSVEDPDSLGFTSVTGLDVGADGSIYVLDWQTRQVRVFDSAGAFVRRIGRQGDGPGEFRNVTTVGVVGDTVWVREVSSQRITLFTTGGELLGTVSTIEGVEVGPDSEASVLAHAASLRPDGRFEAVYRFPATFMLGGAPPDYGDSLVVPHLLFEADGTGVETGRTVTLYPPPSVTLEGGMAPFTVPTETFRVADYPLRFGDSSEPLTLRRPSSGTPENALVMLTWQDSLGMVRREREYRVEVVPITDAMADSIFEVGSSRVSATGWSKDELQAALGRALDLPDYLPPVTQARLSKDGSIWLRRDGRDPTYFRWTVLDPSGEPEGEVRLAREATPYVFDGDHIWAVVTDDFDIPFVVHYRIVLG